MEGRLVAASVVADGLPHILFLDRLLAVVFSVLLRGPNDFFPDLGQLGYEFDTGILGNPFVNLILINLCPAVLENSWFCVISRYNAKIGFLFVIETTYGLNKRLVPTFGLSGRETEFYTPLIYYGEMMNKG